MWDLRSALDYALKREKASHDFYLSLAAVNSGISRELLVNLSDMEAEHVRRLESIDLNGGEMSFDAPKWIDLTEGLASYGSSLDRELEYLLEDAMKSERESARIYAYLALKVDEAKIKELFFKACGAGEKP